MLSGFIFHEIYDTPDTSVAVSATPDVCKKIWCLYKGFCDAVGIESEGTEGEYIRIDNGSDVTFGDDFNFHNYNIIHFGDAPVSETFTNKISTISKHQDVIVEAKSGAPIGSFYEDFWIANYHKNRKYACFFVPWYLSKEHQIKFRSNQERYEFEDSMNNLLAEIGAPFHMPMPGFTYPVLTDKPSPWTYRWADAIDFNAWEIHTENVAWYVKQSTDMRRKGVYQMQYLYPTYIEEAFRE